MNKLFLALMLSALTACNTVKMVPFTDEKNIDSVSINPEVSLPERINYFDLKKSVAIVFSLVAAIAVDRSNQSTMNDLETLAAGNNINVAQILHQAFIDQWNAQDKLTISDESSQVLSLEVLNYGLSVPELSTRSLVPTLKVRATLRDENNEVSWRVEQELSATDNPVPRKYLDDYFVEPETLRAAWKQAAELVASGLVSQF